MERKIPFKVQDSRFKIQFKIQFNSIQFNSILDVKPLTPKI